jgi:hypothetical protein
MKRRHAGSPVGIVLCLVSALLLAGEAIAQTSNDETCAAREAIAANLARLEAAKPVAENLSTLSAEIAAIQQEIANLQPITFGTCPENLGIAFLDGRLRRVRETVQNAVADERVRQQLAAEDERRRKDEQAERERRRLEQERLRQTEERRRREITAKPWPEDIKQAVVARKVKIGMTDEQVRMSWGRPERINETFTRSGTHEQWIYGSNQYLYFENGKLTTIQQSR